MPASSPPVLTEEGVVVGFCDASWNVTSVSGAVISWRGCCLKCCSRRQEVPTLSSAEAEAFAITEASKELVALGTLIETARDGIPLDEIGAPAKTTGSMKLHLYNDGKAATGEGPSVAGPVFARVFGPQTGVQKNHFFRSLEGAKSLENL